MDLPSATPAVRFCEIGKRFLGTVALDNVSFDVFPGTCHGIMGENGAGKSTLGMILAGIHRPDVGEIQIDGVSHHFRSPLDAQRVGIGIVHQELLFCPNLTVAENICLSRLPCQGKRLDWRRLFEEAQEHLERIGAKIDVKEEVGRLSIGQIQLVQIASALATGAKLFVMDEATSSLTLTESKNLEKLIGNLRNEGATIFYVSHRMDEVFRLCDMLTVMRDGRHVATMPTSQTSEDEVVRLMVGRTWNKYVPQHMERPLGPEKLRLERLSSPGKFQDISFSVRSGEVLGMAGLVGAGRSEVAHGLFGLIRSLTGRLFVNEREIHVRHPRDAMANGIGYVSEDRKSQGLILGMECGENITLASLNKLSVGGILRLAVERALINKFFLKLRIKVPSSNVAAQNLSGGNQQKLVLAKWLACGSQILILDEPTRGVDVGAKAEIYRLIDELAASGYAILLISSELPEIISLSTRIVVMRKGRLAGSLERSEFTEERLMQLMAGSDTSNLNTRSTEICNSHSHGN